MRTQKMIDRAARDEERQQVLGKNEWCRRFADRAQNLTDADRELADQFAEAHWPEYGKKCPEALTGGDVINAMRSWNR